MFVGAYSNAGFVRDVLRFLEARGINGAPRFLGVDKEGREMVSFVAGEVLEDEETPSDDQLASAGRLLRHLHDVLARSDLADGEETVRHGDPALHNVVFRGEDAVAFIDWEFAAPGSRLAELADVAWCLLDDRWEHQHAEAAGRSIQIFAAPTVGRRLSGSSTR